MANSAGETPLIRAVQNRDVNTVRLLLMAGCESGQARHRIGTCPRAITPRATHAVR